MSIIEYLFWGEVIVNVMLFILFALIYRARS